MTVAVDWRSEVSLVVDESVSRREIKKPTTPKRIPVLAVLHSRTNKTCAEVLDPMTNRNVFDVTIRRIHPAIILAAKLVLKVYDNTMYADPYLLFQTLMTTALSHPDTLLSLFWTI